MTVCPGELQRVGLVYVMRSDRKEEEEEKLQITTNHFTDDSVTSYNSSDSSCCCSRSSVSSRSAALFSCSSGKRLVNAWWTLGERSALPQRPARGKTWARPSAGRHAAGRPALHTALPLCPAEPGALQLLWRRWNRASNPTVSCKPESSSKCEASDRNLVQIQWSEDHLIT